MPSSSRRLGALSFFFAVPFSDVSAAVLQLVAEYTGAPTKYSKAGEFSLFPVGEVTITFDDASSTVMDMVYTFESGLDPCCGNCGNECPNCGTSGRECFLGISNSNDCGQLTLQQGLFVDAPIATDLESRLNFWGEVRYKANSDGASCQRDQTDETTCGGGPAEQRPAPTGTLGNRIDAGTTFSQNNGQLLIMTNGPGVTIACVRLVEKIGAEGDPHLSFPHGGRGDFRGREKTYYNFLSSQRASLNVMTQNADFQLHDEGHPKHKHVHGSFLTQAHIVARTNTGQLIQLSYYADLIGKTNMAWVNGTVDADGGRGRRAFKLGVHTEKAIDDVTLEVDYSTLRVTTAEFEIAITPINLRGGYLRSRDFDGWALPNIERNVSGLHHRLDISIKLAVAERNLAVAPHGIIGQGWDGDDRAIDGEQDVFPESGEFTTYAMAKGALEGVPDDYVMAAPYATAFKFSRFDAKPGDARPRDVAKLVGAGELNPPQVGAVSVEEGDFVGATERAPTQMQKREL